MGNANSTWDPHKYRWIQVRDPIMIGLSVIPLPAAGMDRMVAEDSAIWCQLRMVCGVSRHKPDVG